MLLVRFGIEFGEARGPRRCLPMPGTKLGGLIEDGLPRSLGHQNLDPHEIRAATLGAISPNSVLLARHD